MEVSDYIWHCTQEFDVLKLILTNGFDLSLCTKSDGVDYLGIDQSTIPITRVCFTNIDPRYSARHQMYYGLYGIAFRNDWLNKNHICPVIYCRKEGLLTKELKKIVADNLTIYKYCKQYSDYNSENRNPYYENDKISARYYEEHEWRFVTDDNSGKLSFEVKDLASICVTSEDEKNELISMNPQYKDIIEIRIGKE